MGESLQGYPRQFGISPADPNPVMPGPPVDPNDPETILRQAAQWQPPPRPSDDELARAAQSRLAAMMGPPPSSPRPVSRLERIGAAAQDLGTGLGMIWQGAHPVMGSGRRGHYMNPNRVQPTNALGGLRAREEADQTRYEQDQARRGLVMAQMFPSYMRQADAESPEERAQKLRVQAALGLFAGTSKVNAAEVRANKTASIEDLSSMFFDDEGHLVPTTTARGVDLNNLFKKRYGSLHGVTDPDELEAALAMARGKASGVIRPKAEAQLGTAAATAAAAAERNTALSGAGGISAGQFHDYQERKKAYVGQAMQSYWTNPLNQIGLSDPKKRQGIIDQGNVLEKQLGDSYDQNHADIAPQTGPPSPGLEPPPAHITGSRTGVLPPGETSAGRASALATGGAAPKGAGGAPAPLAGTDTRLRDSLVGATHQLADALESNDLDEMINLMKGYGFDVSEIVNETDPSGNVIRARSHDEALNVAKSSVIGALHAMRDQLMSLKGAPANAGPAPTR